MDAHSLTIRPIAHIRSDFPTKFAIPRQSGLAPSVKARIEFEPEFAVPEAVRGLDGFSHIWLIWGFSETVRENWSPTVRPPRLGGNTRLGVFATRSTFRPNALALSSVKLDEVRIVNGKPVLLVSGADLMDGTPIYDIKPYLTTTDCHPEARDGFVATSDDYTLEVQVAENLKDKIDSETLSAICEIVSQDPRPAYQRDPDRVYGFEFAHHEIRFSVKERTAYVIAIEQV